MSRRFSIGSQKKFLIFQMFEVPLRASLWLSLDFFPVFLFFFVMVQPSTTFFSISFSFGNLIHPYFFLDDLWNTTKASKQPLRLQKGWEAFSRLFSRITPIKNNRGCPPKHLLQRHSQNRFYCDSEDVSGVDVSGDTWIGPLSINFSLSSKRDWS
jgi:hypothetical protein